MFGLLPTYGSSPLSDHSLLRQTVVFERKILGLTKQSFILTHKVWGRTMSFTKVIRGAVRLSLFVKNCLGLCFISELSWTQQNSEQILSLDLEQFPKFKCCFNQHLRLRENCSKCQSRSFRTKSSLAQDETQNLTLVPTSLCFYSWESESQSSFSFCFATRHDSNSECTLWPLFVGIFQEKLSHGTSNG